jgi:hypothetical protein
VNFFSKVSVDSTNTRSGARFSISSSRDLGFDLGIPRQKGSEVSRGDARIIISESAGGKTEVFGLDGCSQLRLSQFQLKFILEKFKLIKLTG